MAVCVGSYDNTVKGARIVYAIHANFLNCPAGCEELGKRLVCSCYFQPQRDERKMQDCGGVQNFDMQHSVFDIQYFLNIEYRTAE